MFDLMAMAVFLGVVIFVHELGHFTVAKLVGIKVLKFSLGFGKPLLQYKYGDTVYCISQLPLGGFVRMLGEDPADRAENESDRGRAFHEKPLWARAAVIFAGPGMSLAFGVFAFFVYFGWGQPMLPKVEIGIVMPGRPAALAGIQPGDLVISADGKRIRRFEDEFKPAIGRSAGKSVVLQIERQTATGIEKKNITVVPQQRMATGPLGFPEPEGQIGVAIGAMSSLVAPLAESPAAHAGVQAFDRIASIDGKPVRRWYEVERALTASENRPVALVLERDHEEQRGPFLLHTPEKISVTVTPGAKGYGLVSAQLAVIMVQPKSVGARIGLQPKDRIAGAKDAAGHVTLFDNVFDLGDTIERLADTPRFTLLVDRDGKRVELPIEAPKRTEKTDEFKQKRKSFSLGAALGREIVEPDPVKNDESLGDALRLATARSWQLASVLGSLPGALFHKKVSFGDTVGGPILIFDLARKAARRGWQAFLSMMALISLELGIINLLPVPVLDGGHLLFTAIEAVKRRPLSEKTRIYANYVGLALLMSLMLFAISNDVRRYWSDFIALFS